MLANPKTYFSQLQDSRRETKNKLHLLEDIILISLCGAICGYDDWVSIEDFGNENIDWFKEILLLPNGIPYYLTSLEDTEQFAKTVRQHWSIENQQHWVLDVCFSEDDSRARRDNQRSNKALINRSALNLLRANDDSKLSIKRRRIRASMNVDYRMKILFPKQT